MDEDRVDRAIVLAAQVEGIESQIHSLKGEQTKLLIDASRVLAPFNLGDTITDGHRIVKVCGWTPADRFAMDGLKWRAWGHVIQADGTESPHTLAIRESVLVTWSVVNGEGG